MPNGFQPRFFFLYLVLKLELLARLLLAPFAFVVRLSLMIVTITLLEAECCPGFTESA